MFHCILKVCQDATVEVTIGTRCTNSVRPPRRAHEQDFAKRHERELGEMNILRHRETQILLADFNKAQEVLKDKITALQIL